MKHLLTDEQYAQYLSDGILVVQPESLDEAFHDHLYRSAQQIYALAGRLPQQHRPSGYYWRPVCARIPEIDRLFEDPSVSGALSSLLGDSYVIHPHNFVHKVLMQTRSFTKTATCRGMSADITGRIAPIGRCYFIILRK